MNKKLNPAVALAYDYLLKRITSFELKPGEHVYDRQIASVLNISRAPVREAILCLVSDGMLQFVDGKTIVAPINIEDIVDILRVRTALETESLYILNEKGWLTKAQENRLKEIHERFAGSSHKNSLSEHYHYDDAFHAALIEAAGSPRIIAITEQMRLQMQRARWLNLTIPDRQTESLQEHQRLLEAILAHDLPLAVKRMHEHMKNSEASFQSVFSSVEMQQLAKAIESFFNSNTGTNP